MKISDSNTDLNDYHEMRTVLTKFKSKKNKFIDTVEKSLWKKNEEEIRIKQLEEENKILKGCIKSAMKIPEYTLQKYLFNLSEIEYYQDEQVFNSSHKSDHLDLDFINEVIKLDSYYNNENLTYKNNYMDTALHEACKLKNSTELIKLLIEKGANKYDRNFMGQSILHIAASMDNVDLVEFLMKKDIDECIDNELLDFETNVEKQTCLHYAARNGSIKTLIYFKRLLTDFKQRAEYKDAQGRTCLFLAAEYGNDKVVQMLIDMECGINITNIHGKKALYWIISKCPQLAKSVLDLYLDDEKDYSLHHLDVEPKWTGKVHTVPATESILELIVSSNNLDLISHKSISKLIKQKWHEFGMWRSYIDLIITLIYVAIWHLLGTLTSVQERHIYNFPVDGWRICLWLLGSIGIVYFIGVEINELQTSIKSEKERLKQRQDEIKSEFCHPHDRAQTTHLQQEKEQCRSSNIYLQYFSELWNWYDIISILLLITVVCTHIADVFKHSEALAIDQNRIFAITVIVVSLRVFETGRFVNQSLGVLIIILIFCMRKVFVWMIVFAIFWLPFITAFYMIFTGPNYQYAYIYESGSNCANTALINNENCTRAEPVNNWISYDKLAFDLWIKLYGRDYDTTVYIKYIVYRLV